MQPDGTAFLVEDIHGTFDRERPSSTDGWRQLHARATKQRRADAQTLFPGGEHVRLQTGQMRRGPFSQPAFGATALSERPFAARRTLVHGVSDQRSTVLEVSAELA